jgi:cation-transporting ATPase 13A2
MLREMAYFECKVKVKRVNAEGVSAWKEISSIDLVPGDVIEIVEGTKIPCDAIMVNGESVINEAMLTGESAPVVKEPIPNKPELVENFSIENKTQVCF